MFLKISNLKNHVHKARDFLLDLIFPVECLSCGQPNTWLCKKCFRQLKFKTQQHCPSCDQISAWGNYCSKCQPNFELSGVFIAGEYDNQIIKRLIKNLKYNFVREIENVLERYLSLFLFNLLNQAKLKAKPNLDRVFWQQFEKIKDIPLSLSNTNHTIIIPVPLHIKRLRWRGFNQAELIAQKISQNFNFKINTKDLVRTKHKKAQAKLNRQARQENIKNCFSWKGGSLNGFNVILVDDIITTGSTLNEVARILKKHQAQEIWGLVIAKG